MNGRSKYGVREAERKAREFLDAGIPVAAMGCAAARLARGEPAVAHRNLLAAQSCDIAESVQKMRNLLHAGNAGGPTGAGPQPPPDELRALVWSDPAGVTDSPASRKTIVSIHLGASVHIGCLRGGQYHCVLSVHGDIDVIPPGTPSRWELRERDTSFIIRVPASLMNRAAEESGIDPAGVEIVNRFQMRDPQMEHIGWALKAEIDAGYRSGRAYLDHLGAALAACLLDRHSSVSRAALVHPQGMSGHRLRQVLSYIEHNVARELSLKEIAARLPSRAVSHIKATLHTMCGACSECLH
ncbi:MAG TPA: hypothetical protein VMG35_21530 [Bryobacteraceae bacterium]|nr:hypothetical protein [Bryobacteraceae bacterium]